MKNQLHLLDTGVLLVQGDKEFTGYYHPYGNDLGKKKYGFYDNDQIFHLASDLDKTIEEAKKYVSEQGEQAYAIIVNEGECNYDDNVKPEDLYIDDVNPTYELEDVVFSVANINGELVENFIDDIYEGKLIPSTWTAEKLFTFQIGYNSGGNDSFDMIRFCAENKNAAIKLFNDWCRTDEHRETPYEIESCEVVYDADDAKIYLGKYGKPNEYTED